jgi:hypothetical protein
LKYLCFSMDAHGSLQKCTTTCKNFSKWNIVCLHKKKQPVLSIIVKSWILVLHKDRSYTPYKIILLYARTCWCAWPIWQKNDYTQLAPGRNGHGFNREEKSNLWKFQANTILMQRKRRRCITRIQVTRRLSCKTDRLDQAATNVIIVAPSIMVSPSRYLDYYSLRHAMAVAPCHVIIAVP